MDSKKRPTLFYITHGFIGFFVALLSVFSIILLNIWYSLPAIESEEQLLREQSVIITDRNNTELFRLFNNKDRIVIDTSTLPEYVPQAFIAIEDERFYERSCIDIEAISRAVLANIQDYKSQGGSTITQQLVRSIFLTNEKTFKRKLHELLLACKIELQFSKEQVLSMYLNWIPFGGPNYGIEQAAQSYFGVAATELSLSQAVVLAALPQRPTYFSPYGPNVRSSSAALGLLPAYAENSQSQVLTGRSTQVLDAMLRNGYITQVQYNQTLKELLQQEFAAEGYQISAPHFTFWLRNQLEESSYTNQKEGLHVVSTIHSGLQSLAERVITQHSSTILETYGAKNVALLSIDRNTQEIVAYVGNTDYFTQTEGQVDMVQAPRQPGSSFKPVVYATAFLAGVALDSIVRDEPITLGGYSPKNYDGGYYGRMTIAEALSKSRNIPAIKAFFWGGGEEAVLNTAKLLGIFSPSRYKKQAVQNDPWFSYGWPLALGSAEVSLFELVQAYSVFANEGKLQPLSGVRYIQNSQGKTVYAYNGERESTTALPTDIAIALDAMLSDEEARPEGFWRDQLTLPGGSAVKTGTSSKCLTQSNGYCTSTAANNTWVIGYDEHLLTGVWVGNADGSALLNDASGLTTVSPIWRQFMVEARVFTHLRPLARTTDGQVQNELIE